VVDVLNNFLFFDNFIKLYHILMLLNVKADGRLFMNREMWSTKAKGVMANYKVLAEQSLEGS